MNESLRCSSKRTREKDVECSYHVQISSEAKRSKFLVCSRSLSLSLLQYLADAFVTRSSAEAVSAQHLAALLTAWASHVLRGVVSSKCSSAVQFATAAPRQQCINGHFSTKLSNCSLSLLGREKWANVHCTAIRRRRAKARPKRCPLRRSSQQRLCKTTRAPSAFSVAA